MRLECLCSSCTSILVEHLKSHGHIIQDINSVVFWWGRSFTLLRSITYVQHHREPTFFTPEIVLVYPYFAVKL
jgi:hypothetical protein